MCLGKKLFVLERPVIGITSGPRISEPFFQRLVESPDSFTSSAVIVQGQGYISDSERFIRRSAMGADVHVNLRWIESSSAFSTIAKSRPRCVATHASRVYLFVPTLLALYYRGGDLTFSKFSGHLDTLPPSLLKLSMPYR